MKNTKLNLLIVSSVLAVFFALAAEYGFKKNSAGGLAVEGLPQHEVESTPRSLSGPLEHGNRLEATPTFRAHGAVHVLGQFRTTEPLELLWRSSESEHTVRISALGGSWEGTFAGGSYCLYGAATAHETFAIIAEAIISVSAPNKDILLAVSNSYVIDVLNDADGMSRIPNANVNVWPTPEELSSGMKNARPLSKRALNEYTQDGNADSEGVALWAVQGAAVPMLAPDSISGRELRVTAKGFLEKTVLVPANPGVVRVALRPAGTLVIRLLNSKSRIERYDLEVTSKDVLVKAFRRLGGSSRQSLDMERGCEATISLSRRSALGPPLEIQRKAVIIASDQDTTVTFDLSEPHGPIAAGSMVVNVSSVTEVSGMRLWWAELRPEAYSVYRVASAELPISRFAEWQELVANKEYTRVFHDVAPGKYSLMIQPAGIERAVEIADGVQSAINMVLSEAVATIRIWPVGSSGKRLSPKDLGILGWSAHESETVEGNVVASPHAIAIATGKMHFARIEDGCWAFEVEAGREIELTFIGPSALGASAVKLATVSGPIDETFVFRGL